MEDQNLESQVESTEVVSTEETTSETTTTPEVTTESTQAPQDKFVNNLDDAKKVLEAQAKAKASKSPVQSKTNSAGPKSASQNKIDYERQYKEIQQLIGKQSSELGQLRKFYQENQQVVNSYKQFLEKQQMDQMQGQLQQDPMAVIREVARREALNQMAPVQQHYQEQISQAQAVQINNTIREQLGSEYENLAPVMGDMLDQFLEMDKTNGTKYATELAQNPQILAQMAMGKVALQSKQQQVVQTQQAQQKKAQNLKAASGVAKSQNIVSSHEQGIGNMSLDEMRTFMKKQGILQ